MPCPVGYQRQRRLDSDFLIAFSRSKLRKSFEVQMTKEFRMTNDKWRIGPRKFGSSFGLRHSFVIRHLSFAIPALVAATFQLAPAILSAAEPLDRATLSKMDAEISQAIVEKKLPGAVLWVEHGQNPYQKAYG